MWPRGLLLYGICMWNSLHYPQENFENQKYSFSTPWHQAYKLISTWLYSSAPGIISSPIIHWCEYKIQASKLFILDTPINVHIVLFQISVTESFQQSSFYDGACQRLLKLYWLFTTNWIFCFTTLYYTQMTVNAHVWLTGISNICTVYYYQTFGFKADDS